MKQCLTAVLAAGCIAVNLNGAAMKNEQKPIKGVVLPAEWKLFRSDKFTAEDAAAARYEDDFLIPFNGKSKVNAVTLKAAPFFDLASGKKYERANRAILTGVIIAEKPKTIYIGMGADWWIDGFCNGTYFGGTDVGGNDNWPPSATDRTFAVKLRAGRNDLSFYVKPGAGSWQAAIGFYSSCSDPDIPPRRLPEPGIAFGPYLTNPAPDSVTITYLLNGRQPLELEYRAVGAKVWKKVQILRGGQIYDETPILRFNLTGLKPDTEYEYRALRRLPPFFKEAVAEEIRTFRTWSGKSQSYSFFLMGDTQDTTKQKNLARVKNVQKAFPELEKCSFFAHVGDLHGVINHFRNDVFDSVLKAIPGNMYIVSARGNHEFEGAEAQQWLDHFAYSNNKSYGMFRLGKVCYLVLDTGHHLSKNDPNCHQDHAYLNELDTLLEEQTVWLKEAVKTPMFQTADFRIVIAHVAPHGQKDSFNYMLPRTQKMVRDVFKNGKYPLDLWVAGHTHVYKRVEADPQWQFPVVVVSGGGPKTERRPGIALHFDVKPGKIVMRALNMDGTVQDMFELKK